ncbi:choice-of-anchor A family protein [Streptomyces sp. NBC_00624]|uniref:choice-of-anchor A family protein n=1 Tax=Streptomyces sp. NBC_00624 TaxID=2975791 RepID=UPI0030DED18D
MRISTSAAVLTIGGSLVLGLAMPPVAQAAPRDAAGTCSTGAFGTAAHYGEFILGDDTQTPDAEGAVAVGGNADFTGGFSIGHELTDAELSALPGRAALVVRGTTETGSSYTVVEKGNAVVGGDIKGGHTIELKNGSLSRNAHFIDFEGEFAKLRALSTGLAAEPMTAGANVTPKTDGGSTALTLTGSHSDRNVFTVPAVELMKAKEVYIRVPSGATTVVNVTGDTYDMAKAGTTGFFLAAGDGKSILDDKSQSADSGAVRAKLLWNFPDAKTITKHSNAAWPGTVLAPQAHFELGSGAPVNGSLLVASLHGTGGAETHHYPFNGCLPPVTPASAPSGTPSETSPAPGTATPSDSPSPAGSQTSGATPSASVGPHQADGGLAATGANGTVPMTIGAGIVVLAGAGIVLVTRRRKAGART